MGCLLLSMESPAYPPSVPLRSRPRSVQKKKGKEGRLCYITGSRKTRNQTVHPKESGELKKGSSRRRPKPSGEKVPTSLPNSHTKVAPRKGRLTKERKRGWERCRKIVGLVVGGTVIGKASLKEGKIMTNRKYSKPNSDHLREEVCLCGHGVGEAMGGRRKKGN